MVLFTWMLTQNTARACTWRQLTHFYTWTVSRIALRWRFDDLATTPSRNLSTQSYLCLIYPSPTGLYLCTVHYPKPHHTIPLHPPPGLRLHTAYHHTTPLPHPTPTLPTPPYRAKATDCIPHIPQPTPPLQGYDYKLLNTLLHPTPPYSSWYSA